MRRIDKKKYFVEIKNEKFISGLTDNNEPIELPCIASNGSSINPHVLLPDNCDFFAYSDDDKEEMARKIKDKDQYDINFTKEILK